MIPIIPDASQVIVPPDDGLSLTQIAVYRKIADGATSQVTVGDVIYNRITPTTVVKDAQIIATVDTDTSVSFSSVDNSLATVDPSGKVTTLAAGAVYIKASTGRQLKSIPHSGTITGGQTFDEFVSYVSGSLGESITSEIVERAIEGKSKSVRGGNCWIDMDFSCWPNQRYGGCLISPRHLLVAHHARPGSGATVRFVGTDGVTVQRTVGLGVTIPNTDIRIGILNEAVPSTVNYCRVMPSDWQDHLTVMDLPILAGDQQQQVVARQAISLTSNSQIFHKYAVRSELVPFTETIISGDSGSPLWGIIDDELVLLGTHWGANSFTCVSDFIAEINEAMESLGGGYQLDQIDLSAWPSY